MPLQNRVSPFGELCACSARGLFMGNRGGRFHDAKMLMRRRWASRQWICCVLNFKGRRRDIWGRSYTWKLPARVEGNLRISSCKTAYPCNSAGDVERGHRAGADAPTMPNGCCRREWD